MNMQRIPVNVQDEIKKCLNNSNAAWQSCLLHKQKADEAFDVSASNLNTALGLARTHIEADGGKNIKINPIHDESSVVGIEVAYELDEGYQNQKIYISEGQQ